MAAFRDGVRAVLRQVSEVATAYRWPIFVIVVSLNIALALTASTGVGKKSLYLLLPAFLAGALIVLLRIDRTMVRLRESAGRLTARNDRATTLLKELLAKERSEEVLEEAESFYEALELTVWVGPSPDGDRIVEHRRTRPKQPVGHRLLTLVSPNVDPAIAETEPAPLLHVDGSTVADWLPLDRTGRGVVIFTPPALIETQWEVSYASLGLWNPLRSHGVDVFRYDVRAFPISQFSVRFIIDGRAKTAFVQEWNRRGAVGKLTRDPEHNLVLAWTADDPPRAAKYEWTIRVDWDWAR